MNKTPIIIFFFLTVFSVHSNTHMFEKVYEFTDMNNLTDQAIIQSPLEEDYFFSVDNDQLKGKIKHKNNSYFSDYTLDFSYHNFETIGEIESICFSNNRYYLFFTAKEDGIETINVMSFNQEGQLIYREDLRIIFNMDDRLSDFKVYKYNNDNAVLTYTLNGEYKVNIFENDFETQMFHESVSLPVKGDIIKDFHKINFTGSTQYLEKTLLIKSSNDFELWTVFISGKEIHSEKVSDLSEEEALNFNQATGDNLLYFQTETENTLSFFFPDHRNSNHERVSFNKSDITQGYFNVDGKLLYGIYILSENAFFSLRKFSRLEGAAITPAASTLLNEPLIEFDQGEFFILGEKAKNEAMINPLMKILPFYKFILTMTPVENVTQAELFIISQEELILCQTFHTEKLADKNTSSLYQVNGFYRIGNSDFYITIHQDQIFYSETEPQLFSNYVFFKDDNVYKLGYGRRN